MSLPLTAVRRLLALSPRSTDSAESLHRAIDERGAEAPVPDSVHRAVDVSETIVEGARVVRLEPRGAAPSGHLIYLHGGCYTFPIIARHWQLLARLVQTAGISVDVPLYLLAPERTALEAHGMLDVVVDRALAEHTRVHLGGDSSGGGLALASALRRRDAGGAQLRGLLLIAPWLDVTMTDPRIAEIAPLDPMIAPAGLAEAGRLWAGDLDVRDPLVSPLFGDLAGLPQTLITVGDHDILFADAVEAARRMHGAGSPLELRITRGGFHGFPLVGALPEARLAVRRMVGLLGS
jgi:monoterpene epsilon-lactone hydrolase